MAPRMGYVHEPFNPQRWPGWSPRIPPHWYLYVCRENEGEHEPWIRDVLSFRYPILNITSSPDLRHVGQMAVEWPLSIAYRLRGARPLIKDPIALLSSEWLAERFGMQVLVMIRHPAAFAGSLKRLGWRFDFENWRDQPLLLRDLVGPYGEAIGRYSAREHDMVDQAILMWNVLHHAIRKFRERHPEWIFVRHEDLSAEPLKGFRDLFDRLDLLWDRTVEDAVIRFSTAQARKEVPPYLHRTVKRDSRAARWTWTSRLTEEEQARIREGTHEVARSFYSDRDWIPTEAST